MESRLQFRRDNHLYESIEEIEEIINNNVVKTAEGFYALEAEPVVFFYGTEGNERVVLAIGEHGDGVTPDVKNRYRLIDISTIKDDIEAIRQESEGAAGDVSGLTIKVQNVISSLGFSDDGSVDWTRHPEHICDKYQGLTDVFNLLSRIIDELRDTEAKVGSESSRTDTLFVIASGLTSKDEILAEQIAVESGRVSDLISVVESESGRTGAIEGRLDTAEGNIDGLDSRIETAEGNINVLNGISISGVSQNDRMLTITDHEISATFRAEYDSEHKLIKFIGKNNSDICPAIDATDFLVDGMIEDVRVEIISGVSYLVFVFNTEAGGQEIKIPLTDLVTSYTVASGSTNYLWINGLEIGVKVNTPDDSGLATERDINDLKYIVGDGFNTPGEQHTITQKVREVEAMIDNAASADDVEALREDVDAIKSVLTTQLKPKAVAPTAKINFSFFGKTGKYIEVGESAITPTIDVAYIDGKYVSANGSERYAGNAMESSSRKYLKRDGEVIGSVAINEQAPAIQVLDGTYSASADIAYSTGSVDPLDVFGNVDESLRIPSSGISCESENTIKAYRPIYYGPFVPSSYGTIDATVISNMIANGVFVKLDKYMWGEKEYITVQDGTDALAIIVPNDNDRFVGGEIRAILDNKDHGFNIVDQFNKYYLQNVRTYDGDTSGFPYVAYVYDPATEMEESYFKVIN